jgi:hypothetical protein
LDIDRRTNMREQVRLPAQVSFSNRRSKDCATINLSDLGAKLALPKNVILPERFYLSIPARNLKRRAQLVWRRGDEAGIVFV